MGSCGYAFARQGTGESRSPLGSLVGWGAGTWQVIEAGVWTSRKREGVRQQLRLGWKAQRRAERQACASPGQRWGGLVCRPSVYFSPLPVFSFYLCASWPHV